MCCCRTISISWSNTTFGSTQRSNSSFECGFCNAGVHTATNMWWKASLRAETLSDPWRGPPPSRALSLTLPPCSLFPYFLSASSEQGGGGCCTEKGFNKQGNGVRGEKKWAGNWKWGKKEQRAGFPLGGEHPCVGHPWAPWSMTQIWHPSYTPKLHHYHMYGSPSPLIMLITCPAPTDPKNGCI